MITGVAIGCKGLLITLPKPNRHSDCCVYAKSLGIDLSILKNQGFVTDKGKYLDRKKAAKHAKRVNQESMYGNFGDVLISEDLW